MFGKSDLIHQWEIQQIHCLRLRHSGKQMKQLLWVKSSQISNYDLGEVVSTKTNENGEWIRNSV